MARKNLYERISELNFDIKEEYNRLYFLFLEERIMLHYSETIALADYIDKYSFRANPIRGTTISVYDLMETLDIPEESDRIDDLFLLAELILALDPTKHRFDDFDKLRIETALKQYSVVYCNIIDICNRINHDIIENEGKRIIVEKNNLTSHAIELVDDSAIDIAMIEYNHYALKGHLEEKRKILSQIGNYVEPILKSREIEKTEYKQLQSDAGFFLNRFNIRHNNKEGKKAQEYILSLDDNQLEEWYDKIYNTLLSLIICNEQIGISRELKQLKQDYKWIS